MPGNDPDQLLTSHEVAAIFRVSERTIRRWRTAGQLDDCAVLTPTGRLRYRADVIRARANPPQTSGPGHLAPPGAGAGAATNRPEG